MVMYEDKPMNFDNWDNDMYYFGKGMGSFDLQALSGQTLEMFVSAVLERRISKSVIRQKVTFYADSASNSF